MSSVSLFRKWRSQRFGDLVGQEAVVQTLRNVLAGGSPARAYLFCGPRGTGKTSSARIFAKALNCERGPSYEPCNECSLCRQITDGSCLDVLEIDAASHTQVEKIRDFIVDKVHFAPVNARFKVYIIDEVHKLSGASFNALLKTLEEPPSHVVFILATTHPHEVLPTILSRCQRYDFRAFPLGQIRQHVQEIARVEGIELDADAANLVARAADGSMRDALVFLEQCVAYAGGSITGSQAESILGLVGVEQMERLTLALSTAQAGAALDLLRALAERGLDLKRLLFSLQDVLRTVLLLQAGARDQGLDQRLEHERETLERLAGKLGRSQVMAWLRLTLEMAEQSREFSDLLMLWELYLVRMACPELDSGTEALLARVERLERGAPGGPVEPTAARPGPAAADPTARPAREAAVATAPPRDAADAARAAVKAADPAPPRDAADAARAAVKAADPAPPRDAADAARAAVPAPPMDAAEAARAAVKAADSSPLRESAARGPEPPTLPPEIDAAEAARAAVRAFAASPEATALDAAEAARAAVKAMASQERETTLDAADLARSIVRGEREREPSIEIPEPSYEEAPRERPALQGSQAPLAESPKQITALTEFSPKAFWKQFLLAIRERDFKVFQILKDVRVLEVSHRLVLGMVEEFYHGWNREQLEKSRPMLEKLAQELKGEPVAIECVLLGGPGRVEPKEEHEHFVQKARRIIPGEIMPDGG